MADHTTDHDLDICPIAQTAHLIGDTWTLLIVRDLMRGHKRFSELEDSLGNVSPKTLSGRLKKLEAAQMITRRAYAEVPPRVEYSLTEKGHALIPIIEAMQTFGEKFGTEDN